MLDRLFRNRSVADRAGSMAGTIYEKSLPAERPVESLVRVQRGAPEGLQTAPLVQVVEQTVESNRQD